MVFQVCVVLHTWKSGTPIERSITKPPTLRCANMLAPGKPNSSLLSGCRFRYARFCAPGNGMLSYFVEQKPYTIFTGMRFINASQVDESEIYL